MFLFSAWEALTHMIHLVPAYKNLPPIMWLYS
jgi:hypothetical protein